MLTKAVCKKFNDLAKLIEKDTQQRRLPLVIKFDEFRQLVLPNLPSN